MVSKRDINRKFYRIYKESEDQIIVILLQSFRATCNKSFILTKKMKLKKKTKNLTTLAAPSTPMLSFVTEMIKIYQ